MGVPTRAVKRAVGLGLLLLGSARAEEPVGTKLAAGGYPACIAIDRQFAYWTNSFGGGSVMKVPLAGGSVVTLAPANGGFGIAVDGAFAYFIEDGGKPGAGRVLKVRLAGGAPAVLAAGLDAPRGVALDEARVYFTTSNPHGQVLSVKKTGGALQQLATEQLNPLGVAVDRQYVYWQTGTQGPRHGTIARARLGTGALPELLATEEDGQFGIALDERSVYWTNYDSGTVRSVPKAGGEPKTLASGQQHPRGIAVDASRVYWTNFAGPGQVMSAPKEGGLAVVLAGGQEVPQGLAVDGSSVYWVDYVGEGAVMKAPKSAPPSAAPATPVEAEATWKLRENGAVCVRGPCPSYDAENETTHQVSKVIGVDLSGLRLADEEVVRDAVLSGQRRVVGRIVRTGNFGDPVVLVSRLLEAK
jgi:hypothetical protein